MPLRLRPHELDSSAGQLANMDFSFVGFEAALSWYRHFERPQVVAGRHIGRGHCESDFAGETLQQVSLSSDVGGHSDMHATQVDIVV